MKKLLHENKELSARLTGYATAAGAIVALTPTVLGQVKFSGIQDIQINHPGSFALDMNGDAVVDFNFVVDGSISYSTSSTSYYSQFYYGVILNPNSGSYANSWMIGSSSLVAGLGVSSAISSAWSSWSNRTNPNWPAALGVYSTYYGSTSSAGNFLGQDNYVGVRFYIGGEQHYGWIHASMTSDARQLTIHDWAYEQTAGSGITVDDTWGPVPTLTPGVPARTNIQSVAVNVSFDKSASGLTIDDFTISNGTATLLTPITPGLEYSLQVSATLHGTVQVTLPAGAVTDGALDSEEATTSWFYDNVVPGVVMDPGFTGATNVATHTVSVTFSEEVLDVELADFIITNGTKANLVTVTPNREYTIQVTASGEGTVTVELPAGSIIDYGNNPNADASISWMYDITQPGVTLTPDQPALTNEEVVTVTVSFDEEIEDLDVTDFSVTNGVASNLTTVTPGEEYTVDVTASGNGTVSIDLPAAAVTDLAGNDNTVGSASWEYDGVAPTVNLDPGLTITGDDMVVVTVSFSEEIQGIELTDFVITNGTAANLTEVSAGLEYTIEVTASSEGNVIVNLPAGAVTDLAGNDNTAESASWLYDLTGPVATFDTGITEVTNQQTITLGISFNMEVTGMELTDFVVTNGSAANLVEVTAGLEYTVEITATAEGEVSVELPAASVSNAIGNNNEAVSVSWDYDITEPTAVLDHGTNDITNQPTVEVTVQFSEDIEGLSASDFTVTNGTADNLVEVTSGSVYTVEITATADGTVTVELPAASVTDIAGNDNSAGTTSWEYDGTAPVATLDAGVSGSTSEQTVTVSVSFSEDIEGLTVGDFTATNGNVSNLTTVTEGTAYTVDLTATAGGLVSMELPAGSVTDEAGNENATASVSYTYDSGVGIEDITDNLISLYPNPVTDHLTIKLKQPSKITVTYITGQVAMIKKDVLNEVIDVSGLPGGIYLIRIETGDKTETYKFIKE